MCKENYKVNHNKIDFSLEFLLPGSDSKVPCPLMKVYLRLIHPQGTININF